MIDGWQLATIGDSCLRITDGAHQSPATVASGLPMASVKDMHRFGIDLVGCRQIGEADFDRLVRQGCQPQVGDVLIAKDGATALDTVCEVTEPAEYVLLSSVAILRPNPELLDSRYLRYYLESPNTKAQMKGAYVTGAAITRVVLQDFKRAPITLPPLELQQRIGESLGVFDDAIRSNEDRIAFLEHAAQSLFDEWFVELRFPGNEAGGMEESSLGRVPAGWAQRSMHEMIAVDPRTPLSPDGIKPFVPMQALSERSMLITGIEERSGNAGAKFRNGDTLVARITPSLENGKTGYVAFLPADGVGFGSTEFIVLRPIFVSPEWTYHLARSDRFRDVAIKSMSGASGRQRVRREALEELPLSIPPPALMTRFTDVVRPIFDLVLALAQKNAVLRETRDLLLPRLVSGEVSPTSPLIRNATSQ